MNQNTSSLNANQKHANTSGQTNLLANFGDPIARVEQGIKALQEGRGILVLDDEHRENEGDLIFAAESMTSQQMAPWLICQRWFALPKTSDAGSYHRRYCALPTENESGGITARLKTQI